MKGYYKHALFDIIVLAANDQQSRGDVFAGTVIESDSPECPVGTFSSVWMKTMFTKTTQTRHGALDTVESMQGELDTLRLVLGVDAEPHATLPERMVVAAQRHRRAYDRLKEWCNESR